MSYVDPKTGEVTGRNNKITPDKVFFDKGMVRTAVIIIAGVLAYKYFKKTYRPIP